MPFKNICKVISKSFFHLFIELLRGQQLTFLNTLVTRCSFIVCCRWNDTLLIYFLFTCQLFQFGSINFFHFQLLKTNPIFHLLTICLWYGQTRKVQWGVKWLCLNCPTPIVKIERTTNHESFDHFKYFQLAPATSVQPPHQLTIN